MLLLSDGPGTNNFLTQEDLDLALADAAYNGSIEVVRRLLDMGANVNAEENSVNRTEIYTRNFNVVRAHGSVLQAAASGGHLEIVKTLVNKGADINRIHDVVGSALHTAAKGGHLDVVKFLIGHGADIHARFSLEGSVLASSIHPTKDQCFQFLLSRGALKTDEGETALIRAALFNRWDLCHLLLDEGASIHASAPKSMYGSPIQAACELSEFDREGEDFTKRVNFVEHLLDLGADINAPRDGSSNALQAACRNGDIRLVKMLLERGADVNATGRHYTNALQSSFLASRDRLNIIKMLLSNGANVNAQSKEGNALQVACRMGCSKDEILAVLEHGVDIHANSESCGTALQAAVAYGHEWLVRELLQRGVDVNDEGGKYGTALQAAYHLHNGEQAQDMVKLLLEHGADVYSKGGVSGSALIVAAGNLHLPNSSIQQLLDLGIEINDYKQKKSGVTALQAALESCPDEVGRTKFLKRLQFLFERGADANIETGFLGFALQSAVLAEHKNVRIPLYRNAGLEFLLENYPDIDVNAKGGKYGSALQAAAYAGQPESVKLLIQKGADVNAQGGEYKNALNAATIWGYWDIVKILLDNGAEPDCFRSEVADGDWLRKMVEKCGRGARERYRRVWDMKRPKPDLTNQAS
jgi:ankyrin repeat protein